MPYGEDPMVVYRALYDLKWYPHDLCTHIKMPNELRLIHDTMVACEGSVRELDEAVVKLRALRLRVAPSLRSSHRYARPRELKIGLAGTAQIAQKSRFARRMPIRHPELPNRFQQSGSSSRNPARRNVLWFLGLV